MKKETQIHIRIDKEQKDVFYEVAERRGVLPSEAIREGMKLWTGISEGKYKEVKERLNGKEV